MTGLPKPLATDAVQVAHDPVSRSLLVKPAEGAGYVGHLWGRGHEALLADDGSRISNLPSVWASGVRGKPVRDGWLRFTFQHDEAAYKALVGASELGAIVTVDREVGRILAVRFRSR